MTRRVRNSRIESRAARAKLKPSSAPTYADLGGKLHLGYRPSAKGAGSWVARWYMGEGRYLTETLAEADDLAEANGATILSFGEAQIRARAWAADLEAKERIAALGPVITVGGAASEYLETLPPAAARDAKSKLKHIPAWLVPTPLAALTVANLQKGRSSIAGKMKGTSARRVVNSMKAALNDAAKRHQDKLPPVIRDVIRDGLAFPKGSGTANAREKQILSDADIRRIVDAAKDVDHDAGWGGDLYRMVLTLSATGARFGQVARLRVADLQLKEARLLVPTSHKGRGEKKIAYTAVPIGGDVCSALEPMTRGRRGTAPLLLRPKWRRAPGPGLGTLEIYARDPWRAASELTPLWKVIVERAGLPASLVPYCLRHSSITRLLAKGLPVQLVARLHDSSAAMLESNYTIHIVDALEDLVRSAVVPLTTAPPTPIAAVRR